MSLKRMLLASGTAFALIAPDPAPAQQFGYLDQRVERQRHDRQALRPGPGRPAPASAQRGEVSPSRKPAAASAKTSPAAGDRPKPESAAPAAARTVARPAPPPPLTEEQIAAKAAVDELLSREPSLWAARERPDPALARAAAEKHRRQELQMAALKAREAAEEARRREQAEKARAREEKMAALKAKQNPQASKQQPQTKSTKEQGADAPKPQPPARAVAASAAYNPDTIRRMPAPELAQPPAPRP